jgi:hypothetical protein
MINYIFLYYIITNRGLKFNRKKIYKFNYNFSYGGDNVGIAKGFAGLAITIVTSAILLVLGILYYMITIWVIKMGAAWAGYPNLEGNMVVLTAGIVTAASMIGSAIQR